jgi:hypothetical protein
VWDLRRGREHLHRVVIEMYAPTPARLYWLPVELELDFLAVCALMKSAPTSAYRRVQSFQSIRYRGNRLFFDRDQFYEHDLPLMDRVFPRDEERSDEPARTRNARPGRHRADCAERHHRGPCPVTTPSPAHTRRRPRDRRPRRGKRRWTARPAAPRPPHEKNTQATAAPEARVTASEVVLWQMADGDAASFARLRAGFEAEIAADEAAGRFDGAYTRTGEAITLREHANERASAHAPVQRS